MSRDSGRMSSHRQLTHTEASAIDLLSHSPILENGYFRALKDGRMTKVDFVRSQQQFSHAVGYFSRNLAALISRLPTSAGRAVLVHNLSEEHGFDEEQPALGFRPHLAHDRSFARFLETLGATAEAEPEPAVRAFNLALFGACFTESPGFALAALGMIEYAFADISALIGQRVVELGWVKADELVHYSLHAEIDKRHAAELFDAAGNDDISIHAGLSFGLYLFDRLYKDLITTQP
jgi:pyrroloquinoline-quinone synthase